MDQIKKDMIECCELLLKLLQQQLELGNINQEQYNQLLELKTKFINLNQS